MKLLRFELTGEMALWRNVYDSIGSYSCLGPAPSHLAGLLGAALGFASPRSAAASNPDVRALKTALQHGLPWPVSPELLDWEKTLNYRVACRWCGGLPRRADYNVNGLKEIAKNENLRIQQQVIVGPRYEVAVALDSEEELGRLAAALRQPAFPLYLGTSFCRAIVRDCRLVEALPRESGWAHCNPAALGECTPFTRHSVDAGNTFERLSVDGYWIYPTLESPGKIMDDPLVIGYAQ